MKRCGKKGSPKMSEMIFISYVKTERYAKGWTVTMREDWCPWRTETGDQAQ